MAQTIKFTLEQFIAAIPGSAGIITTIAQRLGCNWHTVKRYMEREPDAKQAYDDEVQKVKDAAEAVIFDSIIKDRDVQSAKWFLTLKGKDRGYAQRNEVDVTSNGESIKVVEVTFPNDDD